MSDTQLRRLVILHNLPRYPKKISTRQLLQLLLHQNINSNIRAVQRDLEFISGTGLFGIGVDTSTKPAGWFWLKEAKGLQLAFMDINTAIAFELMRIELEQLLPQSTKEYIEPYFSQAEQLLNSRSHWTKKIVYRKRNPSVLPDIKTEDKERLYEALDRDLCISAHIGELINNEMIFKIVEIMHPLGLLVDEFRTYLIFTMFQNKRTFSVPLHRIKNVLLLDQKIMPPKGFTLSTYLESDPLIRCYQRNIELHLEIPTEIANYLTENPISPNQKINVIGNNWYQLKAMLNDTDKLRTTLRSFGKGIKVITPKNLANF